MNDSTDPDERKKSLRSRIDEMKRQHRDKQLECRKAIKEESDGIRYLPKEDQQARKRALRDRLLDMKQLHFEQQALQKALEEELKELSRLQQAERVTCNKTLREQLAEKMGRAQEEHIRKHHPGDLSPPGFGDQDVRKGFLKLNILGVLAEGPSHGYEIMHRISHHTGSPWTPSPGSMYPALEALETKGFICCQGDGRRKVYSLNPKGQNVLGEIKKKRDEQFLEIKAFMSALFDE